MNTQQKPQLHKHSVINSFFYFISAGNFCICDLEYCTKSKRTFDVKLFDIANNEKLLALLHLYFIQGNYGGIYTYQRRAEWFCYYLSSFIEGEKSELQYQKSITNPMVRILIEDDTLFEAVKNYL